MKKKLFVLLIVLATLPNCAFAKSKVALTCEGLSTQYEDLDCVDASVSGSICELGEEIISLPRKLQLCCCTRISDNADETDDNSSSVTDDDSTSVDFRK